MHLEICVAPFEHLTKMRRPSKLYEGWSNGRGKNQIVLLDYLKVGLCRLQLMCCVLKKLRLRTIPNLGSLATRLLQTKRKE